MQKIERADDRGQQVVEIMRDPAGELAKRFELLGLLPALDRAPPFGNLAQREPDERPRQATSDSKAAIPSELRKRCAGVSSMLGAHRDMRRPTGQCERAKAV